MSFGKMTLRWWLPVAALLLALLCPLPVLAARAGAELPVTVRTDGTAADTVYTVVLTPLDKAPAPAQTRVQVQGSGTAKFTGFAFDEPGDYRYTVAQQTGSAAHTTYDTRSYTVTVRVTGRTDGGLDTKLWAVRSGETAKADALLFVNRYDPPAPAATAAPTAAPATVRTVKNTAAPARPAGTLPQTGDIFPVEGLAALLCAGVVGFGTAWSKRK